MSFIYVRSFESLHPPLFVFVLLNDCSVITSANSTTNPHAVSLVSDSHSLLFAILTVCVPKVPKSTLFVSPTLYLSVFPDFTFDAIVDQSSFQN